MFLLVSVSLYTLLLLVPERTLNSPVKISKVLDLQSWNEYKQTNSLSFNKSENARREEIFKRNLAYINHVNSQNGLFRLEMNMFGHLENHEMPRCYFFSNRTKRLLAETAEDITTNGSSAELPMSVDWRLSKKVTDVKDQRRCGSCYSFSSVGSIESAISISQNKLMDLSEQDVVDCSRSFGNLGCSGGLIESTFEYAMTNGIPLDNKYPYLGTEGSCRHNKSGVLHRIKSYVTLKPGNESELQLAVALRGPVSVAIDASGDDFRFYSSGVYHSRKCLSDVDGLNHAVLVVGYGVENGMPYYLVKNSWSTAWGDKGYIKMSRNRDNNCGIATDASYPVA